jgi:O-antigen/teichoic acid export membrane protein
MSEKRILLTNTLANGTAQFASLASALIFMPMLLRTFGLEQYGLYMLATSIGAYASVLDLGVGTSLTKMIAESDATGGREHSRRLAAAGLVFYLAIGLVAATLLAIVAFYAGSIFKVGPESALLLRNLLLVNAVAALWAWPGNTSISILAGFQRYTLTARTTLVVVLANAACTLAVIVTGTGPLALAVAGAAVGLLATGFNALLAYRELGHSSGGAFVAPLSTLQRILSFSWPVFVIQVATLIVYQQTDRIVLGVFLGATAIALYEAAGKFLGLVSQVVTFANSSVMPMASNLDAAGRHDMLHHLIFRGSRITVAIVAPIVLTMMMLSKPLLTGWLGPGFSSQAVNASILVAPWLFMVNAVVADSVLIGRGLAVKRIPTVIAFTLANLVLSVALVKPLGILGVVLGTALPYAIDYPFHLRILFKHLNLDWRRAVREIVVPAYPPLLMTAAVCALALSTPMTSRLLFTGISGILAVGSYWVIFLWRNKTERDDIWLLAGRAVAKLRPSEG